jgi:predicted transcriptional regulator of viral defense system
MKYVNDIRERFSSPNFPIFKARELRTMGVGAGYSKRLVHMLLSKKEITRITRGVYTFHDNLNVVGFAFAPFYYGLEDALRIRGLSEQGTNPIIVTRRNVRAGVRQFKGSNYVVHRIGKEFFFGYDLMKVGDFWIPVSDVEKTVIDMVYFKDHIRDELWPGLIKAISMKKLKGYLKRYKPRFREKVLSTIKEMKEGV